jgi:hypothetical protein
LPNVSTKLPNAKKQTPPLKTPGHNLFKLHKSSNLSRYCIESALPEHWMWIFGSNFASVKHIEI